MVADHLQVVAFLLLFVIDQAPLDSGSIDVFETFGHFFDTRE